MSAASRELTPHALTESVRSTAVDLMRAAELVAGAPEELPTEELLLADLAARATIRRSTSGSARASRMTSGSLKRPSPRGGSGGPIRM